MPASDLITIWTGAMDSGSFLIAKHDPASLTASYKDYRSVLTPQMSSSLKTFVMSGQYELVEYENNNPRHTKPYFSIRPLTSSFSVIGSGVPPRSNVPSNSLDRLVIVSGSTIGWHCFAEDSNDIATKESVGALTRVGVLLSPATSSIPVAAPIVAPTLPTPLPTTGASVTGSPATGSPSPTGI